MDDIAEWLECLALTATEEELYADALRKAAAEIRKLRIQVQQQALDLLVAHSEILGLYDDQCVEDKHE
jgi:hypothetical protein